MNLDYYQRQNGSRFYATDIDPFINAPIQPSHVSGLNNFDRPFSKVHKTWQTIGEGLTANPKSGTATLGLYRGQDFRDAYLPGLPATVNGAGQSVALFEYDGFYAGDISYYENNLTPVFSAPAPFPITEVVDNYNGFNGTPVYTNDVVEVSLDIEMVDSLAPGAQVVVYEASPDDDSTVGANDILSKIAQDNTCKQISSSWGNYGDTNTAHLLDQLAAQGQAYFVAAGDFGSYVSNGYPGDPCNAANTSATDDPSLYQSIYETLVGGTKLTTTPPSGSPPHISYNSETTWNDSSTTIPICLTKSATYYGNLAGGGGICTNQLAIPSYQSPVPMGSNGGSSSWRNFPDVSMCAYNVLLVAVNYANDPVNGYLGPVEGTSAASPLWAAYWSLVNQESLAHQNLPMGTANPPLYQVAKGANYNLDFNDIADSSTNFYYWPSQSGPYTAVSGFDLATGWGSPKGQSLLNDLLPFAPTATPTPTITRTPTITNTPTITLSPTITYTPTPTATVSGFFLTSNQFNSLTGPPLQITYILNSSSQVDVKVYNVTGVHIRTILSGPQPAGSYYLPWDGKDDNGQPVETGLYLITFKTPSSTQVKKVLAYRR